MRTFMSINHVAWSLSVAMRSKVSLLCKHCVAFFTLKYHSLYV